MKKIFLSCIAIAYAAGAMSFAQGYPDADATNPEKMQWQKGFPPPKESKQEQRQPAKRETNRHKMQQRIGLQLRLLIAQGVDALRQRKRQRPVDHVIGQPQYPTNRHTIP